MTVICDASFLVLLAWTGDDPRSRAARALLPALHAAETLATPALAAYEAGNALRRAAPHLRGDERADVLRDLLEDVLLLGPTSEMLRRAEHLASEQELSFYDASYLAEATGRDAFLLTEDSKLHGAAARKIGARALRLKDAVRLFGS
ncbi:MAG: type II toxin-antitoxin system VapC family toxin [Thermoplasmatota archaeon]